MQLRWHYLLAPSLLATVGLLVGSQFIFVWNSFYRDEGFGVFGEFVALSNYVEFFTDSFYLRGLWITVLLSTIASLLTLIFAYPVSYTLARMQSAWSMYLLAAIVVASFITVVIKVFGIIIIFSGGGWLNRFLLALRIIDAPFSIIGNMSGVVIGLMHYCFGYAVLLMYSIVQTIPVDVEQAAQVHGASRLRVWLRVILPLSLPGLIVGLLTLFNLNAGAFTSAAILGGGRIFTLPVLIQYTVIYESRLGMAAAISVILLVTVVLINILAVLVLRRLRLE